MISINNPIWFFRVLIKGEDAARAMRPLGQPYEMSGLAADTFTKVAAKAEDVIETTAAKVEKKALTFAEEDAIRQKELHSMTAEEVKESLARIDAENEGFPPEEPFILGINFGP